MDEPKLIAAFLERLAVHRSAGRRIIASSSFQTQSMALLHLLGQHAPDVPVYFIDTGFHFPETLEFRDRVATELGLEVRSVSSPVTLSSQRTTSGMFLWTENTERCCSVNKTMPMEPVLAWADVWITGVRRDQSGVRAGFELEAPGPHDVVRLHPMLEWTRRDVWEYIAEHELPRHPLELAGYDSIGCQPCTIRPSLDGDRDGRWAGQHKTECGLHTVLA
ncbi:MAG: phosphoadenylyl-sulfate reductase [Actinomycetota bacterium]